MDDPALATQVGTIITHPAAAERPFLRHFLIGVDVSSPAGTGATARGRRASSPAMWVALGVIEVLGLGVALAALCGWGGRHSRLRDGAGAALRRARRWNAGAAARRGAIAGLALPVAIFVSLGVGAAGNVLRTAAVVPMTLHHPGTPGSRIASPHAEPAATAPPAVWAQLVSIEQRLALQHQALVAQETTVSDLTHRMQMSPSADPTATASPVAAAAAAAAAPSPATVDLARIVELHQATLLAYQLTLEHEYEIFAAAAVDPTQRAELTATAASAGPAGASAAVAYNLEAVTAQTEQDSAINAAVAQAQTQDLAQAQTPEGALRAAGRPDLSPPLGGELTLGFGPTDLPFEAPATHGGSFYPHFHTGLDISAPFDTPVHAAADGQVILATSSLDSQGHLVGYGNYVAISHAGGLTTVYAHLDSMVVRAGQQVHKGDVLGLEGTTGNSTGPHVHFETRLGGGIVDPAPYLAGKIKKP